MTAMKNGTAYLSNQIKSPQHAAAMGNATSAPSAKPRRVFGRLWQTGRLFLSFNVAKPASFLSGCPSKVVKQPSKYSPDAANCLEIAGKRGAARLRQRMRVPGCSLFGMISDIILAVRAAYHDTVVDNRLPQAAAIRLGGTFHYRAPRRTIRRISMIAFAMIAARPALAQSTQRDATPETLFEPERGTGTQISPALRLFPSIEADVDYDTNVYNTDENRRSDALFRLRTEAVLATDLARHSAELNAGVELRRFAGISEEDSEAYFVNAKTLLELGGHIDVRSEVGYVHAFEQRGSAGDVFETDKPIAFDRTYAEMSISRFRSKLGLELGGRKTWQRFSDATSGGVPIELDDRDVNLQNVNFRVSYKVREGLNSFAQISLNEVEYQSQVSSLRNSDGISLLAGIQFQPSEALNLEVAGGYLRQKFDDPAFQTVSDPNYRLSADWTPRRTWKLRAEVKRDVDASPRFDTPAIVRSEFQLGVQHSVGDRLLFETGGASVRETYSGIARTDRFYRAGFSARYRINSSAGVSARIGYRTQSGGRDYDGLSAGVGLRVLF